MIATRLTALVAALTAYLALLTLPAVVHAQTATKEYQTQPTLIYTFDVDPKSNYAGGYLQSNGSSFEYTSGSGSHTGVLSMDGSHDYLDLTRFYDDNNVVMSQLQLGGEMSFEAWVCWTSLDYWSRIFDFAGASGSNDNNIFLSNQWSTTNIVFETYVGSSNTVLTYSGGVGLYSWQHLVATITKNSASTTATNGAILSLYINGVLVANTTGYLPTVMQRTKSWVGRSNWESSGDARFRGLLDDFFIYNYSLPAEAIVAHYVVPRVPVFELTFNVDPRINMNLVGNSQATYSWISVDSTDSPTAQYAHTGLLQLTSSSSQYLDVSGDNGYAEVGTNMPTIGGNGWFVADNDTQGWTFEVAFKLSTLDSGACVFDIGNPSSTSGAAADDRVALCVNGPALTLEVSNAATSGRVSRNVMNQFQANRWYHVIVMVQPFDTTAGVGRYEAYVDGTYRNSTNSGVWLRSVTRSKAYIGRSSVSTAPYLNGLIDSIRVYDYAMTAAEVRSLYRAVTFNTTTATASFYSTAPTISHTFDVSVPWSERNGGTTLGWTGSYQGRAGITTFGGVSDWINLLTLPDRNYNLFPGYIGGRSISFEFWVMWTQFGAYTHLLDLGQLSSISGVYVDNIVISTLEQTNSSLPATLRFSLESGSSGVTDSTVALANAVYLNRWYHLVCTIDVERLLNLTATGSATLEVYINGVLMGTSSSVAPRYANRADSWIAKGRNSWDAYFGGYIDAFHYYDYEVELEAVRVHYIVPRPPLFELVFAEPPYEMPSLNWTTNYGWASNDTKTSTAAGQINHQGLLSLTAAAGHYIDLAVAFSTSSTGTILPQLAVLSNANVAPNQQSYEFPSSNTGGGGGGGNTAFLRRGMSIETSFLYTSASGANAKLFSCSVSGGFDLIELGWNSGSRDLYFSVSNSDIGITNTTTIVANAFYQKWFHVLITMRAGVGRTGLGQWSVYINGQLAATYASAVFPYSTPRDACALGRSAAGDAGTYFDGYVDSFRVYDYVVNSTEVASVYATINGVTDAATGVDPTAGSTGASTPVAGVSSSVAAVVTRASSSVAAVVVAASSSAAAVVVGASSSSVPVTDAGASSSSSSLSGGSIAGIVIGCIVGAVIVVGLLMAYLRFSKGRKAGITGPKHVEMSEVRDEEHESEVEAATEGAADESTATTSA